MSEKIQWVLRIFLIVLGVILIYQMLRKIFGGSWEIETIILTLVVTNITHSFYQIGWSKQFEKRFEALARDFKEHHHKK
ncbi:MAG TPA: hypothetical protein VJI15_04185 [Candidatus Nanoarchaeia archaeon]|nr:hypothetical protein [Candidatus Nanoarchaeia archaeon]